MIVGTPSAASIEAEVIVTRTLRGERCPTPWAKAVARPLAMVTDTQLTLRRPGVLMPPSADLTQKVRSS